MPFIARIKKPGDLDPISVAFSLGILTSVSVLILGIISSATGYAENIVTIISYGYLGYENSLIGAVIGAVWGFFDGFIGGLLFALLYNFIKNKRT